MKLGTIFTEEQYDEAYEYVSANSYTIEEVEPKEEWQEKEVEVFDEEGNVEIKKEKELVLVRYFQIVEIPVYKPTNEEISQQRQNAYTERTDPLTLRKLRKQALGEWTTEDEKEYVAQIQAISAQIASDFPYNSEEPSLGA